MRTSSLAIQRPTVGKRLVSSTTALAATAIALALDPASNIVSNLK